MANVYFCSTIAFGKYLKRNFIFSNVTISDSFLMNLCKAMRIIDCGFRF